MLQLIKTPHQDLDGGDEGDMRILRKYRDSERKRDNEK